MDIECNIPLVRSPLQTPPSPVGTPTSPDWSPESPPVLLVFLSLVATLAPAAALDEDALLEIGAQLELHGIILQEETGITMGTLWRPILALEAWAGYTDAQRGALWQSIYEDRREIYDLRRQHAADQREMHELKDCIATLEQRMDS
ncbi:hypothetical protein Tco_0564613 [Tanacetum coccineum]